MIFSADLDWKSRKQKTGVLLSQATELQLNAFRAHKRPLAGTFQQAARLLGIRSVSIRFVSIRIVTATLASSRGLLGLRTRRPVWALDFRERVRLGSAAGHDTRRDPFNHVLPTAARTRMQHAMSLLPLQLLFTLRVLPNGKSGASSL
jgi:hypothetical protein